MSKGTCPVCNGSGKVALTEAEKNHSWNRNRTEKECQNCGGQYMYGSGRGEVNLNKEGVPCTHVYQSSNAGRCLTNYTCIHCGDRYQIDSGD
jgi:hypothetical protein